MRIPLGLRAAAGALDSLPVIGSFYEGGYIAGYISHTADGVATHGLIVAPAASGYTSGLAWKTENTSTSGTTSEYDGAANTANMSDAGHPAANYCANLSIGGYTDWYLPAVYELDIAYYNLRPGDGDGNSTSFGTNIYAVPQRLSNYTSNDPPVTSVSIFQSGNAEAFLQTNHWTSTESSSTQAKRFSFYIGGFIGNDNKTVALRVRAFRKFSLS